MRGAERAVAERTAAGNVDTAKMAREEEATNSAHAHGLHTVLALALALDKGKNSLHTIVVNTNTKKTKTKYIPNTAK